MFSGLPKSILSCLSSVHKFKTSWISLLNEGKFQEILLSSSGKVMQYIYIYIYIYKYTRKYVDHGGKPTGSPASKFYGQPKIHMPGVLIRLIFSYSASPLYKRKKYIANILKAYTKDEEKPGQIFYHVFQIYQNCSH